MKIEDITETLRTVNTENIMSNIFNNIDLNDGFSHIGDIEYYSIYNKDNMYVITENLNKVGYATLNVIDNNKVELEQIFINKHFRNMNISEMFILFVKRILGYNKIYFGYQHSDDALGLIKKLKNRFDVYWENSNGDVMDYNDYNNKQAYSYGGKTDWQVVLENNGNLGGMRFFDQHNPHMDMFYQCLIEDRS